MGRRDEEPQDHSETEAEIEAMAFLMPRLEEAFNGLSKALPNARAYQDRLRSYANDVEEITLDLEREQGKLASAQNDAATAREKEREAEAVLEEAQEAFDKETDAKEKDKKRKARDDAQNNLSAATWERETAETRVKRARRALSSLEADQEKLDNELDQAEKEHDKTFTHNEELFDALLNVVHATEDFEQQQSAGRGRLRDRLPGRRRR